MLVTKINSQRNYIFSPFSYLLKFTIIMFCLNDTMCSFLLVIRL